MLAALGLFVFDLATFPFAEMSRRSDWRHTKSERVGARAASQFLGPGEEAVTLAGAIVPGLAGSYAALTTLRQMADQGEAWPLVDGNGIVWGNYSITGMDERRRHLLVDGTPRIVDFTLDLDRID